MNMASWTSGNSSIVQVKYMYKGRPGSQDILGFCVKQEEINLSKWRNGVIKCGFWPIYYLIFYHIDLYLYNRR